MVEASGSPSQNPPPPKPSDEGDAAANWLQWTAQLVSNVDKRLRATVSVEELKKLCISNALPEFKKVLQ